MPILKNRPLCTLCALFLFGIFLTLVTDGAATPFVAVLSVLLFVFFLVLRRRPRRGRRLLTFLSVCAAVLLFSQIFSFLSYVYPTQALRKGEELTFTARVEEILSDGGTTALYAALESADGEPLSGRVLVYFDEGEELVRGDRITFLAVAGDLSGDNALYRKADGCIATLREVTSPVILSHSPTAGDLLQNELAAWREALSRRLIEAVPGEGGALMSAMLLGERDALSSETVRDFRRLGISHILAISGLHLQILVLLFTSLLQRLGLRRRLLLPIVAALILFYMALTGFSPSVMRAGVMALLLSLSFLVRERADSLTALFFAATLICLFSPATAYDIGFLLSCFATLGILAMSELRSKRQKTAIPRPLSAILSSLLVTVSATLATLPITALFFGEISVLSPLANLLLTPLFSVYLACTIPAMIFAPIPFVGSALSLLGEWILLPVTRLAEAPHALIDLAFPDFIALALCGGAVFFLLLSFAKRRRTLAVAGISLLSLLLLSLSVHTVLLARRSECHYLAQEQSELLLLCDGGGSLLYDASGGRSGTAWVAYDLTDAAHVTELDAYLLSHYHGESADMLATTLSRIRVRQVYLPTPTTEEENGYYRACLAACLERGAEVLCFEPYEEIPFSALTLIPHATGVRRSETHGTVGLTVKGELCLTYLGAGMAESDMAEVAENAVAISDYLIFGTHGLWEYEPILYPKFKSGLRAVVAPRAQKRLHSSLFARLSERGLLSDERTAVLSLSD